MPNAIFFRLMNEAGDEQEKQIQALGFDVKSYGIESSGAIDISELKNTDPSEVGLIIIAINNPKKEKDLIEYLQKSKNGKFAKTNILLATFDNGYPVAFEKCEKFAYIHLGIITFSEGINVVFKKHGFCKELEQEKTSTKKATYIYYKTISDEGRQIERLKKLGFDVTTCDADADNRKDFYEKIINSPDAHEGLVVIDLPVIDDMPRWLEWLRHNRKYAETKIIVALSSEPSQKVTKDKNTAILRMDHDESLEHWVEVLRRRDQTLDDSKKGQPVKPQKRQGLLEFNFDKTAAGNTKPRVSYFYFRMTDSIKYRISNFRDFGRGHEVDKISLQFDSKTGLLDKIKNIYGGNLLVFDSISMKNDWVKSMREAESGRHAKTKIIIINPNGQEVIAEEKNIVVINGKGRIEEIKEALGKLYPQESLPTTPDGSLLVAQRVRRVPYNKG